MDAGVGMLVAFGAILISLLLDGSSPMSFVNLPAMVIIFGGTFGATMASYSVSEFKRFPTLLKISMKPRTSSAAAMRAQLVTFAERARREGLLALEADVDQVADPFVRRGLQMVIDGLEPETVEDVLELDIEATSARHDKGAGMFQAMGGYAPTMGIIGTVIGLVSVLGNMEDPAKLAASIAVAFIATLVGILTANVLWLPIAVNLKQKNAAEIAERRMALVAILAIHAGDNPRIVAQKLQSFADPSEKSGSSGQARPGAPDEAEQEAA